MAGQKRGINVEIPRDLYLAIQEVGVENEGAGVPYLIRKVMREWLNTNPVISITKRKPITVPPDPGAKK